MKTHRFLKWILCLLSLTCSERVLAQGKEAVLWDFSSCFYFDVEVNYLWIDTPKFSYGSEINAAGTIVEPVPPFKLDETAANCYPKGLLGFRFDSGLPFLGCATNLEVYGFLFNSSTQRDLNRIAIDTNPIFGAGSTAYFPYITGVDQVSASTPNNTIINGFFKRSYDYLGGGVTLFTQYCVLCFSKVPLVIAPFIDFGVNEFNQDYAIEFGIVSTGLADFDAIHLKEDLKTTYYDLGLGVGVEFPLFRKVFLVADAGIYASCGNSRLHASQSIFRTPALLAAIEERQAIEEEKTVWDNKVKASVNLAYPFHPRVTLLVGVDYEYWGNMPRVENPQLDPVNLVPVGATRIKKTSASNHAVGVKFLFHF